MSEKFECVNEELFKSLDWGSQQAIKGREEGMTHVHTWEYDPGTGGVYVHADPDVDNPF